MTNIPFKKPLAIQVAHGTKTQTRRRRYESDIVTYSNSGDVTKIERLDKNGKKRTLYAVGMICPVQTDYRSKSPFSVEIVQLRPAVWSDLSYDDARAEGFDSPQAFLAYARALYPKTFDPNGLCWAVTLKAHVFKPETIENPTYFYVDVDLYDHYYRPPAIGRVSGTRVDLFRYAVLNCVGDVVAQADESTEDEYIAREWGNQHLEQLIADYGDDE